MRDVVICSATRTAIGTFNGTLSPVKVTELGSIAVKEAIKRAGIAPDQIEEVILGNVLQGAAKQGPGRQAAINAGVPVEVPAYSINILCGSGLKSVILGAQSIYCGCTDVMLVGGMESMTNAPYLLEKARSGYRMGHDTFYDSLILDGLTDAFHNYHMGMTAENIAEKYSISREEQDAFALASQEKAAAAIAAGRFKDEITPVVIKGKKGDIVFEVDEHPKKTTLESLAKLRPAFKKDGTVTAGNASGINDGAAAMVIMSAEKAKALGIKPLARIIGYGTGGVDPSIMGMGPVPASLKAMKMAGINSADELDLIEANEAFASQCLGVGRELKLPTDRLNVNGGAIALGHPVGASGARILVSLIYEMQRRQSKRGLATLCIGGGMGAAVIIEM